MLVLGIESSCDETAAALVADGRVVLSNVVASQIKTHRDFGGVVPELASREHLRNIGYVVRQAFTEARKSYRDIDGIAVTQGPGLIGSLLVGVSFAKAMAYSIKSRWFPSTISKDTFILHSWKTRTSVPDPRPCGLRRPYFSRLFSCVRQVPASAGRR